MTLFLHFGNLEGGGVNRPSEKKKLVAGMNIGSGSFFSFRNKVDTSLGR